MICNINVFNKVLLVAFSRKFIVFYRACTNHKMKILIFFYDMIICERFWTCDEFKRESCYNKKCSTGIFRISYCVNRPGVKRSSATEQQGNHRTRKNFLQEYFKFLIVIID